MERVGQSGDCIYVFNLKLTHDVVDFCYIVVKLG